MGFLFPIFVALIFLWVLCTWIDEQKEKNYPIISQVLESEKKDSSQDLLKCNKDFLSHNLKIKSTHLQLNSNVEKKEHPHDHQEHHPDMPYAMRPRRLILRKPDEETEEDKEPTLKKPKSVQKEDDPLTDIPFPSKSSTGTHKDVETNKDSTQMDLPAPCASVSVQAMSETEHVEVQTEPPLNHRILSTQDDTFLFPQSSSRKSSIEVIPEVEEPPMTPSIRKKSLHLNDVEENFLKRRRSSVVLPDEWEAASPRRNRRPSEKEED